MTEYNNCMLKFYLAVQCFVLFCFFTFRNMSAGFCRIHETKPTPNCWYNMQWLVKASLHYWASIICFKMSSSKVCQCKTTDQSSHWLQCQQNKHAAKLYKGFSLSHNHSDWTWKAGRESVVDSTFNNIPESKQLEWALCGIYKAALMFKSMALCNVLHAWTSVRSSLNVHEHTSQKDSCIACEHWKICTVTI